MKLLPYLYVFNGLAFPCYRPALAALPGLRNLYAVSRHARAFVCVCVCVYVLWREEEKEGMRERERERERGRERERERERERDCVGVGRPACLPACLPRAHAVRKSCLHRPHARPSRC